MHDERTPYPTAFNFGEGFGSHLEKTHGVAFRASLPTPNCLRTEPKQALHCLAQRVGSIGGFQRGENGALHLGSVPPAALVANDQDDRKRRERQREGHEPWMQAVLAVI